VAAVGPAEQAAAQRLGDRPQRGQLQCIEAAPAQQGADRVRRGSHGEWIEVGLLDTTAPAARPGQVLSTGRACRGRRAIVRHASLPRAWPMDLQAAFEHALPSPGWALAARRGTLAAFVAADAWAGREGEALALLDDRERGR